jgi:hypothetical protein
MTLLGSITYEPTERFLGSFIRYEEPRQLFYDNLVGNALKVETDRDVAGLLFDNKNKKFKYLFCDFDYYESLSFEEAYTSKGAATFDDEMVAAIQSVPLEDPIHKFHDLVPKRFLYSEFDVKAFPVAKGEVDTTVDWRLMRSGIPPKPYSFNKSIAIDEVGYDMYLMPPHGSNIIEVIQTHPALRKEIARMFERYGQKLQLRVDERKLEVIKDQDGMIYSYPYSSVADTLQRIIFYLAAIESNDDAVLLFEEPEAHSFPVYVARLGRRIAESRNNQFFIDTHSPYLVTEILERMLPDAEQAGELAIFAAYYDDHQTKLHQLSDDEVRSIREDGIDVFYNLKRFTTGAADA